MWMKQKLRDLLKEVFVLVTALAAVCAVKETRSAGDS